MCIFITFFWKTCDCHWCLICWWISWFRMHILSAMVLLHCLVCCNASSALNKMWQEWRIKHGKSYGNQVGLSTTLGIYLPATDQPVRRSLPDGDSLPESSVGEEPALCGPTQPGGFSWKARLHDGTQPSVRPGENHSKKHWVWPLCDVTKGAYTTTIQVGINLSRRFLINVEVRAKHEL